ncbi:unnamed protein product [Brachionus calyciflorus]|uniref:Peptidase A2 domain-containing protein n=1 Tax=Brachionus calyciflorus TaxID=104777 RepID=A0A814K6R5_9BILA|nr:unnamed protein product [Brachionus calyciflorus]
MAVTWLLNWFKKKPLTQFQYVRHEQKITPTKYTINQDFNVWKKGFELYAKNVTDKTNALLSLMEESCIEQLEQRLLIRNPNASYEEIIKISSKLFGRNPIYNDPLMEFVLRTQLQNETIFQFMFELENLAEKAYLQHDDRFREPIIVDRFIRGLRDNRVLSELCQMETIETIQEVLDKANQLEIGFQKCKQIIEFKNSRTNEMDSKNNYNFNNYKSSNNQFNREDTYFNQEYQNTKPKVSFQINSINKQNVKMVQNKRLSHNFEPIKNNYDYYKKPSNLKSKNVISDKFGKKHQLNKQLHQLKFNNVHQNTTLPTNSTKFLNANAQQISNYSSTVAENLEGDCLINNILTHFQIDTGSDITAISEKKYNDLQNHKEIITINNDITGADGSNLIILGKTRVKIQFGTYITHMDIFIIKNLVQECLIGLDFVNKFNGFRTPIDHLKSALKKFTFSTIQGHNYNLKQSKIFSIDNKPKIIQKIQSNLVSNGTKFQELVTSTKNISPKKLNPSTITNDKDDLINSFSRCQLPINHHIVRAKQSQRLFQHDDTVQKLLTNIYQDSFGRQPIDVPFDLIIAKSAMNNGEGEVTVNLKATETKNNYKAQVDQHVNNFKEVSNWFQKILNLKIEKSKFYYEKSRKTKFIQSLRKKTSKRQRKKFKDKSKIIKSIDQLDTSKNDSKIKHGSQNPLEIDCPVQEVHFILVKNKSFLESLSDIESESSHAQTIIPSKNMADQVFNQSGHISKSTRLKKPIDRLG